MQFDRQLISNILFASTYVTILLQLIGVLIAWDHEPNTYLYYYKYIFYLLCVMSLWSHYKASFTPPGKITHDINSIVLEFYINLHEVPVLRAEKFNESYGKMIFEKMSEEERKEAEVESDHDDYDDYPYEAVTSITEQVREKISKDYRMDFKRCDQCCVVRTPRVHHCSMCRGCIMKRNHHCPWINNCVGQFNQKFFIQFCYYCFSGCFIALVVTIYYIIYKNKKEFMSSKLLLLYVAIQLIFCVIFFIFTGAMLNEQWNIIQNDTTLIDIKQDKFLEKRDFYEVLNETMGGGFGIHWLLPIKEGGYKPFFNNLKQRKEFS